MKMIIVYIAKLNANLVLVDGNKYSPIDLDISSFDWDKDFSDITWSEEENFLNNLFDPPIVPTAKIICVGKNYIEHAKEMGSKVPKEPLLFQKPPTAALGHNGEIILPEMSQKIEHETELVIIIRKKGKNILMEEADDYIFGYTIGLDITARDLQRNDKTWFRGKGFDTFAPIGPWIVSPSAVNLSDCNIELFVNEDVKQKGNTKDMVFNIPNIISYISKIVTLNPGDIIFTGTPEGVGPIRQGDKLRAKIDGIGTLIANVK
ncbi:MAG: fumarylacetoacetate hydrolase family protein [Candidatus Hodarchaeales archaeon]|jgi:2-keto-4-pentenoate hydratase/2-oxohepta-3-ene-1,7-dioic acid hydratase in catechol pathway